MKRSFRFWRSNVRTDVDDEMLFHLQSAIDEYVAAGMSLDEANDKARERFGNFTAITRTLHSLGQRRERAVKRKERLSQISQDVRFALRSLRRAPGFTIAVLTILALGIGMSTAMFTVYKTVLVDRLPIAAQERVIVMHPLDRGGAHLDVPASYLSEIERDSAVIRGVSGVYHLLQAIPLMDGGALVNLNVAAASANFFQVLGMQPHLGRLLVADDGVRGAPLALVLSYAAWRRDFGGDSSIIGRSLVIVATQERARIVGIAPIGFAYPSGTDVWRAIPPEMNFAQVDIIARLAPRATMQLARDGVFALTQRSNPFPGNTNQAGKYTISGMTARLFSDAVLGDSHASIVALTIGAALLLIIACVNIGNLSLVRLLGRMREIAVRSAIGASSRDIVQLFAVENVLLGVTGGALGLITALGALNVVRVAAPPQVPRIDALNSFVVPILVAAGITLFALLVFGVLPSFMASRIRSYLVLRADSRSGGESHTTRRMRQWLVVTQIALAVMMLNGAGLLARTLSELQSVDLGYQAEHLSIVSLTATQNAMPSGDASTEVGQQLIRRLEVLPGMVAATPITTEPFVGQSLFVTKLARIEQPALERDRNSLIPFEFGGPDYFRTFAIPILRGRGFAESDRKGAERVVVVNEVLAKQLWPNEEAIGKRLVQVTARADDAPITVIGVASATRFRELRDVGPVAYFPWEQMNGGFPRLIALRTDRPLGIILPALRATVSEINPAIVLWKTRTMDQLLDAPLAQPRLSAVLLAGFSGVALLLSAIGLYGVIAAGVRRQTREFGVRLALGAMPTTIVRLVLSQVFVVAGIGLGVGLAGALIAARALQSLLFQVEPIDLTTVVAVCAVLVVVAALASFLPARHAAHIDPVDALRAD